MLDVLTSLPIEERRRKPKYREFKTELQSGPDSALEKRRYGSLSISPGDRPPSLAGIGPHVRASLRRHLAILMG
jgi:hypothetical protein